MKDLHSNVHVIQVLLPAAITAAKAADNPVDRTIGAAIGASTLLAGPAESVEFVFTIGAVTGTTPTVTPVIEESADNVTWTAVAAADLLGGALPATFAASDANSVYKRGYIGTQRYVRARISAVGGTTPSFTMACQAVLGHIVHAPAPATL